MPTAEEQLQLGKLLVALLDERKEYHETAMQLVHVVERAKDVVCANALGFSEEHVALVIGPVISYILGPLLAEAWADD